MQVCLQRPRHHGPGLHSSRAPPHRLRPLRSGDASTAARPAARNCPAPSPVPGLAPVGTRRPPRCCSVCGAALPWARQPRRPPRTRRPRSKGCSAGCRGRSASCAGGRAIDRHSGWKMKEIWKTFCGRCCRCISTTCGRRDGRRATPPACEPTSGSPRSGSRSRSRSCGRPSSADRLTEQLKEDAAYYRGRPDCRTLVVLVYDPEGRIPEPRSQEAAWSVREDEWELRRVISTAEAAHSAPNPRLILWEDRNATLDSPHPRGAAAVGRAASRAAEPVAATVETTLTTAGEQIRQLAFDGDPDTYFASDKNAAAADHFTLVFDKPDGGEVHHGDHRPAQRRRRAGGGDAPGFRGRQDVRGRGEVRGRNRQGQAGRPHDPGDPHPAHGGPQTSAGGPRDRGRFGPGRDGLQVPRRVRGGRFRRAGDEGVGRQGRPHLRARISAALRRPQERRLEAAPASSR